MHNVNSSNIGFYEKCKYILKQYVTIDALKCMLNYM